MDEEAIYWEKQRMHAHQFQFLVGVQGSAFTLRPLLHPLQDVLSTGESA